MSQIRARFPPILIPISSFSACRITDSVYKLKRCGERIQPWAKTIKKNTNSTQNKCETHHAKQYEVTSFLSTDCELSTETCSKNVYSLGPLPHSSLNRECGIHCGVHSISCQLTGHCKALHSSRAKRSFGKPISDRISNMCT